MVVPGTPSHHPFPMGMSHMKPPFGDTPYDELETPLVGGNWLPFGYHFPRNIGNVIIPIDELIFWWFGTFG